jgi:hypothetical protein
MILHPPHAVPRGGWPPWRRPAADRGTPSDPKPAKPDRVIVPDVEVGLGARRGGRLQAASFLAANGARTRPNRARAAHLSVEDHSLPRVKIELSYIV